MHPPARRRGATRARLLVFLGLMAAPLAVAACATTGMHASAQDLDGCYFFEQDDDAVSMRLPQGIRLTAEPLEGWPAIMQRGDVNVAVTLTRNGEADYPFGYWLMTDDGVEVGYPGGGGIVMALRPGGAALTGSARAVGDARPVGQDEGGTVREIDVRLEAGACPM